MNKAQRKRLEKAIEQLDLVLEIINEIKDEEQDKYDNLPEGLQQTEANLKIEQYASDLEGIQETLEESRNELYTIIEN
ncbi:hypothetical protein [Mucilaginibacter sp.]